jgi:PAS domain S-box-containing protein
VNDQSEAESSSRLGALPAEPGHERSEEPRHSEEPFHLLAQGIKDYAILMLDPQGRIVSWNEGAERITGWTADEVIGRSLEIFYPPDVAASGFPKRELETAERNGRFEDENWRVRKDGSQFWANVIITCLRSRRGAVTGFSKVTCDLTTRRESEARARALAAEQAAYAEALRRADELAAANESLRLKEVELTIALEEMKQAREAAESAAAAATAAYHELDQFAYAASHDLRAPLRAVANLAQWIQEDCGDRLGAETVEHLRLLMDRVHRMEALIDGILAYSRAARTPHEPEVVDTGKLVRSVIELLAPPDSARIAVAPGMPVITTERLPLEQVLMNLIGNAIKHGHAGRPEVAITITARDAGDAVEFAVSDDGPGIPPEFHERIWGIFQTLAARDKVEGTGIGLALVKKIVERRGGRVSLDSRPGSGATFRFLWPRDVSTGADR